jgi:hypothetical protein
MTQGNGECKKEETEKMRGPSGYVTFFDRIMQTIEIL